MASFQDARIQIAGNHLLIQRPSEVRSEEVIQDSAARSAQIVIQQQELKERLLGMRRMAASTSRKSQTSREDGHSLTIMV